MTACSTDPITVPDIYELCVCLSNSTSSYLDQVFEAHFSFNEEAKQTELDKDDEDDDEDMEDEEEYEEEDSDDDDDDDYFDTSTDNDDDDGEDDEDQYEDEGEDEDGEDEEDEDDEDGIPLQALLDEYYNLDEMQYGFVAQREQYDPVIQHKQDLFFLIAMYAYCGGDSLKMNYFNLLKHYVVKYYNFAIGDIYIDDIISVITSFISTSITFCSNLKHSDYYNGDNDDDDDDCDEYANYYNEKMKQLTFEQNESIIRFDKSHNDYLNVISNQCIIQNVNDYDNEKLVINCYILAKGDEMWMGLINKTDFYVKKSIENKSGSLLYYGGRECLIGTKRRWSRWDNGFGAIHGFGDVICSDLVPYQCGDWITFLIDLQSDNNKSIKIFKNGIIIYETDKLPFKHNEDDDKNDEIYFVCTVDDDIDAVFIEQSMFTG